jgi:hypothetical protein
MRESCDGRQDGEEKRKVKTYEMIQNLVTNDLNHLERGEVLDGIDEHVAMDADEML